MAYNYGSPISGTIGSTGSASVSLPNTPVPVALVLNSSNGSRAIQLSFDSGATFYPAVTPTLSETAQIVYVLTYPCTTIKFTGASGDTFSIVS